MQAVRLSRWRRRLLRGRLQSRTGQGHPACRTTSARLLRSDGLPFLSGKSSRISQKGMISYHVGFLECAHEHASRGQHVRKRFFNRSSAACQEQNSHQFRPAPRGSLGPKRARKSRARPVTPEPFRSSRRGEFYLRRSLAATGGRSLFRIPSQGESHAWLDRPPRLARLQQALRLRRAAFLLRDVFDTPFPDIAAMLDRSESACRQLASRARRAVHANRPVPAQAPDNHARLLEAFAGDRGRQDRRDLPRAQSRQAAARAGRPPH
jgi:Sigma-70, region 4